MKYIIIFFLLTILTNCTSNDLDFNPTTSILKQLTKDKTE
jgi:hypothetical protein